MSVTAYLLLNILPLIGYLLITGGFVILLLITILYLLDMLEGCEHGIGHTRIILISLLILTTGVLIPDQATMLSILEYYGVSI